LIYDFVRVIHGFSLPKYFRVMMGKKSDLKQIDAIAREFQMSALTRKLFGKFLEKEKANGYAGTLNTKGDFTWEELYQKAEEFLQEF